MTINTTNPPASNNTPNIDDLMKKAQEIQQKMKWAQAELASVQVTGYSGGKMITVLINGKREVLRILIDDSALKENKEVLQDLLAAAVNDAIRKVEQVAQEKMMKLAKDFGLPEEVA